mmetsp:Transcript_68596/g.134770  ORF Transcript_68596/g.134770 Transcript_68596/m.134770 type:complete len:234 (-) Transcript_68596:386-1087(-)|eukprot:CAMPEP_0170377724 /NCGR_PEP_ID=MMETSP0117_2-20130122/12426_1 /TAXON_ID=400756 /ORGANISM="Durinskia baltica, Strain CSIRO CS-38" /LENGTH=233 /DNA_ID=CAMNT_0010633043 /DNA_START=66 /DNA_END=767 /DNA_ORIENTATION=-
MAADDVCQLKLLTIGDSGVGKTWLLLRWAGVAGKLSTFGSSMPTIGIDFKMKTVVVYGRRIKVQVWDTAGQERFRNITTSYYRHSQGVILVYDITDESTFNSIRSWIRQIKTHSNEGVCIILVGNKCDLEEQRMVPYSSGEALGKEFGIPFMETSAVNSINVDEVFSVLTYNVYEHLESQGLMPPRLGGKQLATPTKSNSDHISATRKTSSGKLGGGVRLSESTPAASAGCCT